MREDFYECTSVPRNEKLQKVLYNICNVVFTALAVLLCIFLFFLLMLYDVGFLTLSALAALIMIIVYFLKRRLLVYYDYTFIRGEIRIVKIVNGKNRKFFSTVYCKDILQVGKVGSASFETLTSAGDLKIRMATSNGKNAEAKLFYIFYLGDGEKNVIVIECDEKMLSYIVSYCGKGVVEKDYVG